MKSSRLVFTGVCLSFAMACSEESSSDDSSTDPLETGGANTDGTGTGTGTGTTPGSTGGGGTNTGGATGTAPTTGTDDGAVMDDATSGGSDDSPGATDGASASDDSGGAPGDDSAADDSATPGDDGAVMDDTPMADDGAVTDDTAADDGSVMDDMVGADDLAADDSSMMDDMAGADDMTADDSAVSDDMGNDGPPEGAYEPCSGAPMPALQLTEVLNGLDAPIHMTTPQGDANTAYVTLRGGRLVRADLSQPDAEPTEILTVATTTGFECGFFSTALHPNFDGTNENRLYVSFINGSSCSFQSGSPSRLDEYELQGNTATFVQTLFEVAQPEGNHNGGLVAFGPDGYLYYGLGDGGGSNDQHGSNGNGQDVNVPLGKILRFDVDALDTPPPGNLTSADVGGGMVDGRVLHYGVRNPWRWSFDRLTGDMFIGDVGQSTWEEVNVAPAGSGPMNFGWSAREGEAGCNACGNMASGLPTTDPIHAYPTNGGGGGAFQGSVTGGFVYRGNTIPGLYGRYLYADYVRGDLFALTYDGEGGACDQVEDPIPGANIPAESLVSFAEDANGEIYVINMSRGTISRVAPM